MNKERIPGSVIIFEDKNCNYKISEKTGCNQTGILVSEKEIICRRHRKVVYVSLDDLKECKVYIHVIKDREIAHKIVRFFKNTIDNYRLFQCGLNALHIENYRLFDSETIMPKFRRYHSIDEYNREWDRIVPLLRKGDLINTFQSTSFISKFIANLDKGVWSHSASYIGYKKIQEAISKGVVKRELSSYKDINTHIGIYRAHGIEKVDLSTAEEFWRNSVGWKYAYFKAIILGIRTLLGLTDDKYGPRDKTPNGLVYAGNLYLVDYL